MTDTTIKKVYVLQIGENYEGFTIDSIYHNIDMAINEAKKMVKTIFQKSDYTFSNSETKYEWKGKSIRIQIVEYDVQ